MASGDLSNQVPIIPTGPFVNDASIIGGMPGGPLPDSQQQQQQQQRHWIPDERDAFISWLRGEFAAANAMIDTLCHHLQVVGKPGEYDFVLTCIQQRRYNWTVVLHMQQYFSVAEVVFALQQVVWLKQAAHNSDPSAQQQQQQQPPPHFGSLENGVGGGGPPWKEGPIIYRDPRGDALLPGGGALGLPPPHTNPVAPGPPPEEPYVRKEVVVVEMPRKGAAEEQQKEGGGGEKRRGDGGGDQERTQTVVSSNSPDSAMHHSNRNASQQADLAQQDPLLPPPPAAGSGSNARSESSTSYASSSSTSLIPIPHPSQGISVEAKEEKQQSDQGSLNDQLVNSEGNLSTTKLEATEERVATPYFQIPKEEEDRRIGNVKVVKSYSCMEQIEGKMVNTVDGLELHEKVLDKSESSRLVALIQDIRTAGKRGELGGSTFIGPKKGVKGKGRELLQFGHSHHHLLEDHKKRSLPRDDVVQPVPAFLEAVIDRLVRWRIIPTGKRPDCCSINIMEEGDYVSPNVDNSHLERPYYTLTIQSECSIVLGQSLTTTAPGDFKGPLQISLPVGSVLVLQRNSADLARHSISSAQSKRIFITLGKLLSTRPSRGFTPPSPGVSQSPPLPGSMPSTSWGPSYSHNNSHRQGSNNSNLPHNNSGRAGGGFAAPFKPKYTPVSSGGVLPNPTTRPPAQIMTNVANAVPPMFSGTPGPPAGGAFPPSMAIPSWSPLPRPPPPNRPSSAGTGVFFPSSGASSGPGRPVNASGQRRSGNISSSPPILQKTNSAPASFASLEAAALAATAAPSTPPGKSSKPSSSSGSFEKVVTAVATAAMTTATASGRVSPGATAPQDSTAVASGKVSFSKESSPDPHGAEANGAKNVKDDSNQGRSSGRASKAMAGNSRTNLVSTGHS